MLLEVAMLQRFVLLLGHPVYSLTVTLFSLLLGTGLGSFLTRSVDDGRIRRVTMSALLAIVLLALVSRFAVPWLVDAAIPWSLSVRIAVAVALLVPAGILLGMALPGGMRMLAARRPEIVPWGWGMNGAFSVVGATLAVFIAMNWGFSTTFMAAAAVYGVAAAVFPK
jgi:predicted membrane-bound spermidine synthase